jgi:hypothetical protein
MFPADLPHFMLSGTPALYCVALLAGFNSLTQRHGSVAEPKPPLPPRSPALSISVAESPEALAEAIRLVRQRYAWRGYETGQLADAAASRAQPNEVTLLAQADGTSLGTLTLRLDSSAGLGAEEGYPGTVAAARAEGRRVCELTRFAIAETSYRKTILASLFSLAYAVGRTKHGVTDVFVEVNPRHVGFYRRAFGFAVTAGERFCERVRAPSVLLRLELAELERRLRVPAPIRPAPFDWTSAGQPA